MGCPQGHHAKIMDAYSQYAFLADFKREARRLLWRNEVRERRATKVPYAVGCAEAAEKLATDRSYEE